LDRSGVSADRRILLEINLRLSAEEPLRDLTARVLKQGLDVLGIETVKQM